MCSPWVRFDDARKATSSREAGTSSFENVPVGPLGLSRTRRTGGAQLQRLASALAELPRLQKAI